MALSAFDDRASPPDEAALTAMLGRSSLHWRALRTRFEAEFTPFAAEWNFAGAKYGWSCRLKHRSRVILYLTPCRRHFLVGLVVGEKAVKAAREAELPAALMAAVEAAPRYGEGRGFRLEVRKKADLAGIFELATIKMRT